MKKVYLLGPGFISYLIVTLTAIIIPGSGTNGVSIQYGYPLPFLYVDKETILDLKDSIIDKIAIDLLTFIIDILILVVIINILIRIYKFIARKIKESKITGVQR